MRFEPLILFLAATGLAAPASDVQRRDEAHVYGLTHCTSTNFQDCKRMPFEGLGACHSFGDVDLPSLMMVDLKNEQHIKSFKPDEGLVCDLFGSTQCFWQDGDYRANGGMDYLPKITYNSPADPVSMYQLAGECSEQKEPAMNVPRTFICWKEGERPDDFKAQKSFALKSSEECYYVKGGK